MTDMGDLVTWLRAQLDDDEQHAQKDLHVLDQASALGEWQGRYGHNLLYSEIWADDRILFRVETPRHQVDVMAIARMVKLARKRAVEQLAEVGAKRRILEAWRSQIEDDDPAVYLAGDIIPKLLALPYAGREGYREEWRPS